MILQVALLLAASVPPARPPLVASSPAATPPARGADGSLPKYEPGQLVEDFRIARQALEEGHAGIYRYTPKEEMNRVFEAAEGLLNRRMDAYEFYRVLAPAVAAVKCGHTEVVLPPPLRPESNARDLLLPVDVRVLNGRVYVRHDFTNLSGRAEAIEGKEILSVNGVPATRLVSTMLAATPGDGDIRTSRQWSISGRFFAARLISLFGLKSPYDLTLRDGTRESGLRVNGVTSAKLREASAAQRLREQAARPNAELKFMDGGRVAVMTIRSFTNSGVGLRTFYKEAFAGMQSRGTRALVLDLRDNGGGDDELGALLLSHLVERPFKYYADLVINAASFGFEKHAVEPISLPPPGLMERGDDGRLHFVGHPNMGLLRPSFPRFTGKVFALMNGRSFSTTSEFLSRAHSLRRATFVGEEAGGGYYGNTSGTTARVGLTHTKLELHVPLAAYYMAVGGHAQAARGVMPDYPVGYSVAELLSGLDKEMNLALELARRVPASK